MYKKIFPTYFIVLVSIIFSSCSNQQSNRDLTENSTPTFVAHPTSIVSDLTPTSLPNSIDNGVQANCPVLNQPSSDTPILKGNILFHIGSILNEYETDIIVAKPGIWSISSTIKSKLIIENAFSMMLSPDGKTLLIRLEKDDQESDLAFYDLASGSLTPYDGYSFMQLWFNGEPQYGKVIERIENVGIKQEVIFPNIDLQTTEKAVWEFDLPDYTFNDSEQDRGILYGYESIDPRGELFLYTAYSGDEGQDFEVRLYDLQSGTILWNHKTNFLPSSYPQWTNDGENVLFDVSILDADTTHNWWKVVQITRKGEVVEFPPQPFPLTENGGLNHYSVSPNGQYLFYTTVAPDENLNMIQQAFIVNIETGVTSEICDPESEFIASIPVKNGKIEGVWLPNNLFVYRTLIEKEGNPTHSIRILDIPSWTSKILFEPESGNGVEIIGWTPVEFP